MIVAVAKMGMLTGLALMLAACVGAGRGLETTARSIDRELTTRHNCAAKAAIANCLE